MDVAVLGGSRVIVTGMLRALEGLRVPRRVTLVVDYPLCYARAAIGGPRNGSATVVLTSSRSPYYLRDLLQSRPDGLLVEPISVEELREALLRAAQGERVLAVAPSAESLSPREREVLRLVVLGLSNHAIAAVLKVRPKTAAHWVSILKEKLGAATRADIVARYYGLPTVNLPAGDMEWRNMSDRVGSLTELFRRQSMPGALSSGWSAPIRRCVASGHDQTPGKGEAGMLRELTAVEQEEVVGGDCSLDVGVGCTCGLGGCSCGISVGVSCSAELDSASGGCRPPDNPGMPPLITGDPYEYDLIAPDEYNVHFAGWECGD